MHGRQIRRAAILTVVLALTAMGTAHSQTATSAVAISKSQAGTADPSREDFTTDLTPIIAKMKLHEGTNFVTETADGLKVYAVVQVTDIVVKDATGKALKKLDKKPRRTGRNPQTGSARMQIAAPGSGTGDDDPRCWHCYDKGGQTHCFEIKCPFLAAPGSGE